MFPCLHVPTLQYGNAMIYICQILEETHTYMHTRYVWTNIPVSQKFIKFTIYIRGACTKLWKWVVMYLCVGVSILPPLSTNALLEMGRQCVFPLHFIIDKCMDTDKMIWFRCHQERKYFSRTIIKGITIEWLYGRNLALFYKCAYYIGIIYVKGNTIYFLKHFHSHDSGAVIAYKQNQTRAVFCYSKYIYLL
jgi:hypothetical protein